MGIAVKAYNTEFNDTGYVRATFDNLTSANERQCSHRCGQRRPPLTPTKFVQIGTKGIPPPQAGPLPSNWATGTFA